MNEPTSKTPEPADHTPGHGMIPDLDDRSVVSIVQQYRATFQEILDVIDEVGADATTALLNQLDRATERALIRAVYVGYHSEGVTCDDFEVPDRCTICTTVTGDTADRWRELRRTFDGFTCGEILTAMVDLYTDWVRKQKKIIG